MANTASTPQAAGVKTPGTGAYSDPATVGAMIQKMYPQYANFDAVTLGQRWINVHTPQTTTGTGGATGDLLAGPVGTTPMTSTDPTITPQKVNAVGANSNVPDLSQAESTYKVPQLGLGVQQSNQPSLSATFAAQKPQKTKEVTSSGIKINPKFATLNKLLPLDY